MTSLKEAGLIKLFLHDIEQAIIVSGNILFEKLSETSDAERRYILIKGRLERELVIILNVYTLQAQTGGFTDKCLI